MTPERLAEIKLYRIHWRVNSTGETGHSTGLFERELAELWVKSLNADKDNRALTLVHWMVEEAPETEEL